MASSGPCRAASSGSRPSSGSTGTVRSTCRPIPRFYERIAEAFPDAWLEDPDLTIPEADAVLAPHRDRIMWDAPIHSVADIESLAFAPRGMGAYGGGQYELGVGRGQIQCLASLFHPDGPSDIAPGGYGALDPGPGLVTSPLEPRLEPTGFRWVSSS